jgi:site-specific DNA recombinase
MKPDQPKLIFFLYARKSSESDDRQVQSIEDQVNRLKLLASDLKIEIKEILTEAKSAKKPDCRPVFTRMMERIEKGEANGILCWQINRLSRNPIDSGRISWMLQQGILQSIQTIDRQYLPDDNVLLFSVESGSANQFIIDLRKNSKRGMDGKVSRGWLPSRAPLGYLNDKLEHTIYEDAERFNMVRKMWDLMLTGNYTAPMILDVANKEWGFRVPKRKRGGGGELAPSVIYKMFTNIFYTGMFDWKGQVHQGKHKPMITMEEYDRVQIILGRKGKPRSKSHDFAFTGIMQCEVCGSMYTAVEKTKFVKKTGKLETYTYYHCTRRKKGVSCTQRNPITLKELEDQAEAELERHTILPQFQQWALQILNRENDKEIEDRTKIYENQHKSLVETQKELDELTRMRYRQLIDDETFVKERGVLQEKTAKLKNSLRETESRAEKWIELTERTFTFAAYARHAFITGTLEKKREIFAALGRNFLVKDKKVSISGCDWFVPIQKAYSALEADYKRLELTENGSINEKTPACAEVISRWGGLWELNPY